MLDGEEALADPKRGMLAASDLRRRGWTAALIRQFVPVADAQASNPRCDIAASMNLFECSRIGAIEASDAFQTVRARGDVRRESARRAQADRREALLAWATVLPIVVPAWDTGDAMEKAIRHYEGLAPEYRFTNVVDGIRADPWFLYQITVEYLAGWAARAEEVLEPFYGTPGWREAHLSVRIRILLAIADAYPRMGEICRRSILMIEPTELMAGLA